MISFGMWLEFLSTFEQMATLSSLPALGMFFLDLDCGWIIYLFAC